MQRVDEFIFYDLAINMHPLTELSGAAIYNDIVWTLQSARHALDNIYKSRPLHFSAQAAVSLYQSISSIVPTDFSEMVAKIDMDNPITISGWEVSLIKQCADEFETALRTECAVMDAYYVVKKGAFSTKDLVENAHYQIPKPSTDAVPQITRDDFDQAGKCLAFDVYTAAAFHLLRGTEAVLIEYYLLVVPGPKQATPKMRNWGTYIRLIKLHDGSPKIISVADHLRDAYRNPVLHPNETFNEERVLALLGLCVSAIILIQSEIETLKATSGTLQFPKSISAPALP